MKTLPINHSGLVSRWWLHLIQEETYFYWLHSQDFHHHSIKETSSWEICSHRHHNIQLYSDFCKWSSSKPLTVWVFLLFSLCISFSHLPQTPSLELLLLRIIYSHYLFLSIQSRKHLHQVFIWLYICQLLILSNFYS